MLRSIKEFYGNKLGASDGEIGHVKDFYFDDQSWAVRYVIADTGTWLTGRNVLLSPHAFGPLHQTGKLLAVNLNRKQIEDSPAIELHRPVSRQYEEEYYRHYGWPFYWKGEALWGMSGFPILESVQNSFRTEPHCSGRDNKCPDAHLRSTQAIDGYQVSALDGNIGHVSDFKMDSQSWAITKIVIKTGHGFSNNELLISTSKVIRIDYDVSTVFVDMTTEQVQQNMTRQMVPMGSAD